VLVYTLYPFDFLRPRDRSNFRPTDLTFGLVVDPGTPAAPKNLQASRAVRLPRSKSVLAPVGDRIASWSSVKQWPPAASIRFRAVVVYRSAAIVSFRGTSNNRASSVTVPTNTMILEFALLRAKRARRESVIGGRFVRDIKSRFNTTRLKELFVRRAKKRYNLTSNRRYKLLDLGASRHLFLAQPPALKSIPIATHLAN